jgi:hypothetical protein
MARIFLNKNIEGNGRVWSAKNGATRTELVLILNDQDFPNGVNRTKEIVGSIGFLDKGNHSFIFINKEKKKNSNSTVGVFLNSAYSFSLESGKELYSNYSSGGSGNSCSKFGVYTAGSIIKEHTYKHRTPSTYYILRKDGWKSLGSESDILCNISDPDCSHVAKELGLINSMDTIL